MITGQVMPSRDAVIRLQVSGPTGHWEEIEASIDTGFNRYLTLPPSLISALGLPFDALTRAELADGRITAMRYYRGNVTWDGRDLTVPVLESEGGPLVGMSLLYGYELRVQVVDGGSVTIERLP